MNAKENFITNYSDLETPSYYVEVWKEEIQYIEQVCDYAEIVVYKSGHYALIVNGNQCLLSENIYVFNSLLSTFVIGMKIAKGNATDNDYI